jgi:D-alanyl-D-alanine dipeptidase
VDIYIYENNSDIGFGKHGRETYPTYDIAPGDDLNNRLLLLDVMTFAGFTPYYGEFWHFMYGDTE